MSVTMVKWEIKAIHNHCDGNVVGIGGEETGPTLTPSPILRKLTSLIMHVKSKHEAAERGSKPGGGGTQKSFIQGGPALRSNPLPFYIPFFSEKAPLPYTFYWKKAPLSYTFLYCHWPAL